MPDVGLRIFSPTFLFLFSISWLCSNRYQLMIFKSYALKSISESTVFQRDLNYMLITVTFTGSLTTWGNLFSS